MEKKKFSLRSAQAARDGGRVLRNGMFATAITAAALVLAILVSLIVDALPKRYTEFDLSEAGIYTISDTTKEILQGLEQDVTMYYLAQTGSEDVFITGLLDRYTEYSDHVTWEQIDPAVYPTFASQYDADSASDGSVIVVSGEKSNLIDFTDFYPDYYSYSYGMSDTNRFDGENCLTTAVYNVTSGESSHAYYTTNHGEASLGSTLLSAIEKQNITVSELDLLTSSIPEDCDLLIVNCPQQDFSGADGVTDEISMLESYLEGGGKLILTTDSGYETPNLDAVMAEFGLSRVQGLVVEGDANYYSQALGPISSLLTVNYSEESAVTSGLDTDVRCLLAQSQGIAIAEDLPADIATEALLVTSDTAFSKVDGYDMDTTKMTEKEENDIDGPFNLAVYAENTTTGAQVTWVGSGFISNDTLDMAVNGGNSKLLLACAAAMTGQSSETLVDAKALESETLTFSASTVGMLGLLFPLVLPLVLVAAGIVAVVMRRRH